MPLVLQVLYAMGGFSVRSPVQIAVFILLVWNAPMKKLAAGAATLTAVPISMLLGPATFVLARVTTNALIAAEHKSVAGVHKPALVDCYRQVMVEMLVNNMQAIVPVPPTSLVAVAQHNQTSVAGAAKPQPANHYQQAAASLLELAVVVVSMVVHLLEAWYWV